MKQQTLRVMETVRGVREKAEALLAGDGTAEAPPSVLLDISPSRGEIDPPRSTAPISASHARQRAAPLPISPLEGEMSGRIEGGAAGDTTFAHSTAHLRAATHHWRLNGRSEQHAPTGDWRTWLLIGGRGSGKTRAGAEWVHETVLRASKPLRFALVAETLADAREVMIDGISGICRIAHRSRPDFEISRRRLVWPNGSIAQVFSSEDPDSLRGPQFDYAWCDELGFMISCTDLLRPLSSKQGAWKGENHAEPSA